MCYAAVSYSGDALLLYAAQCITQGCFAVCDVFVAALVARLRWVSAGKLHKRLLHGSPGSLAASVNCTCNFSLPGNFSSPDILARTGMAGGMYKSESKADS
jgi:hypothetical protein